MCVFKIANSEIVCPFFDVEATAEAHGQGDDLRDQPHFPGVRTQVHVRLQCCLPLFPEPVPGFSLQ
jgi:hypothetical protein